MADETVHEVHVSLRRERPPIRHAHLHMTGTDVTFGVPGWQGEHSSFGERLTLGSGIVFGLIQLAALVFAITAIFFVSTTTLSIVIDAMTIVGMSIKAVGIKSIVTTMITPTTAALAPARNACSHRLSFTFSMYGAPASMNTKDGRKTKKVAMIAPGNPPARKPVKVVNNINGPGVATLKATPSSN